jgi:hypothetical protein
MAGVMLSPQKWRFFLSVLTVTCMVPSLSAVTVEIRDYHGKQIQCVHGGNWLNPMQGCGTPGYAQVFTGTVKSAVDVSDTNKQLVIIPDEVFLGDPVSEVTATVNQGCFPQEQPEIQPGDRWLFYLQIDRTTGALILGYDSPSKPIGKAKHDIATLRHLARLTNSSILTGNLTSIASRNPGKVVPVPDRKVVARRSDGTEYAALTDSDGYYEFELPPDSYRLTANSEPGMWAPEYTIDVWQRECVGINFLLHTDGRISGTVTEADGRPARFVQVAIVQLSPSVESFTVATDSLGHFEVGGRGRGSYLVGEGVLAQSASSEWPLRVYYPGVTTRQNAKTIELGLGEWRTDIDFSLPPTFTAP